MNNTGTNKIYNRKWAILAGLLIVLAIFSLYSIRLITGRGMGIQSFVKSVISLSKAVINSRFVKQHNHGDFINIIFLHHSVGNNLIEQGGVRELFQQVGYDFWDHGYNDQGLRTPDGKPTGYSYNVPDDNTDPDGLARIFTQKFYKLPINTLSGLMQHEVIVVKSCFPTSNITSDEQFTQFKAFYLQMRNTMDLHPDKIFIVVTQPPLNPAETNPQAAIRASMLADWLKSTEFLDDHPNIFTFDLFNYLAEGDRSSTDYRMLRQTYREGTDSHPNKIANQTIGPLFVEFVIKVIQEYRGIYKP